MSLTEEVAAGVAQALGPIADNIVNSVGKQIRGAESDTLAKFSGKQIKVEFTITIPDLTKSADA